MAEAGARPNLALYPWYAAASLFHPGFAVFYLYLASHFPLERLLELEAIYYASYVILEVPSGYLSDRVGRRLTLLVATAAGAAGYLLFALGASFAAFALGQVCLAVFWSFRSGTDASLHYDSLVALGRAHEYAQREALAQRGAFAASAAALLLGGALGAFSLRAAYVATFAASLVPIALVAAMHEPPRREGEAAHAFLRQLRSCAGLLRAGTLRWLFGFFVASYALEHVTHTFYQPYLAVLLREATLTPLATGLHAGAASLVAALVAARTIALRDGLGVRSALLLPLGLQAVLVGLMAATVHPAVALLAVGRQAGLVVTEVLVQAEVAPRVPQGQRATYLSLQGLAGRLAFSGVLLALSALAGGAGATDPGAVRVSLTGCFALGALAVVALLATRRAFRPLEPPPGGR
jgi:predicted MFS family arabinose efflux permease